MPKQIGAASSASIERFFQFAILGLVASGYLAIAGSGYVDWPTVILAGIGLIWRAAIISGAKRLQLPEIAITSATIAYMVFAPIDYLFLEQTWIAATIHVVFFVAGIKTLTARTARDYLFVAAVAFIELLAAAIFSSSGTFFLCLAAYLLCAVAARSTSELRRLSQERFVTAKTEHAGEQSKTERDRAVSRVAVACVVMTLGILALTAGLFLILPRTANAALHFIASSRYHLTGFTSDVTLGETGNLQQDSRVVMHVSPLAVEGYSRASDLPLNLKWRGLALERFDGRRWSTDPASFRPMPANGGLMRVAEDWQRRRRGKRILYRVEIQNIDADALFVAGAPEFINVGQALLSRSATGAFRFRFTPLDTLRYEIYSFLGPDIGAVEPHRVRLTAAERQADLAVPRLDPRITELAHRITLGASSDLERARLIEKYLRKIDYSLDLPDKEPRDPIASFLFVWKKGYCEYFASSMAVMLRDLGIPARLATGFQSGIQNPYSGSVVIRASDAHTWVEAFLPDSGWTVFDPTPPAASAAPQTIWTKLSLFLDAADTFWRDWVLRYDLGQQLTLASRVEAEARRIRRSGISNRTEWMTQYLAALRRWLSSAAVAIAICVTALLLGWIAWRGTRGYAVKSRALRGHTAPSEATIFYERMLVTMKQRGYQKPGWFTPREFASSIPHPAGDDVERFTASYYAVRFGGYGAAARDMSAALEKLNAK